MAPKLILTGFMATGKTAGARAIARRPGWQLVDCDERIVARAGKSIPEIFRTEGEPRFREIEREVIREIASEDPDTSERGDSPSIVIATGGGAMVDEQNFAALSRCGVIVCLAARPDVIARRAGPYASSRPLLAAGGKPLRARIAELIEARRDVYACAAITLDTSDLSIAQSADAVIAAFTEYVRKSWTASA